MTDNSDNFSLTHEEHRRIYEGLTTQHLSSRTGSRKPRAIIVLCQPGSESTSLVSTITERFSSGDFVLVDEEALHQQATKYEQSIKEQMNLVILDSCCDAVAVADTLRSLRENGYTSSVYVVSAHERESLLSLYQNYEGAMAARGYVDRPQISEHDKAYEALPETLRRIESEKSAEEIMIADRKGQIFYSNALKNNEWTRPPEAANVLEEDRNRAWTPEEITDYRQSWNAVIKGMEERGASRQEVAEADSIRTHCLKSIRTLPPENIAELNKVEENEIDSAVSLLKNPRSLDNSSFRGYEAPPQQNDTLDMIEQIKKTVQESKTTLEKLKQASLSPEKDITKNKIVRQGQFPHLKEAEVVSRMKDTLMLVKGRSLFIYELKRLELKAPALGQPGEKLDLRWPAGQEKARGTQALERDQHHSRARTQQEKMR